MANKKDLRFVDSLITPRGQGFSKFLTGKMNDDDKDGIPNYMDCAPNDPNRDGLRDWIRRKVAPKEKRTSIPVVERGKIYVTPKEARENDFSSRVEVVTKSPVQESSVSRRTGGGGSSRGTSTPTSTPTLGLVAQTPTPKRFPKTQAQEIQERQAQQRIKEQEIQRQIIARQRQAQQTRRFPTTKKEVRDIGVSPVGVVPTPSGEVSPKDDRIVVYDTETGTAYLSDEPVRKARLPERLQRRAEEAREEKKFAKGQLLSTGAFVTSYATTLASIPVDTVKFVLSPIKSTKGLIEYVKSGGMKQDIQLGLAGGGEVLAGKTLAFATAPKIYGKAIPKKVSAKFSKKAKQFKDLSEAEPTVSVGYKRTKGNIQELTVETGRTTGELESITSTKYQIEKVGDNFQISKGKGTTTIEKLKGKNKGKLLEQEFTFTGEAQPAKVTRVKSYKKSYLDDAILLQKQPLPSKVSPVKGRIEMLTRGEKPKLTREPFFGISKKVGGVDVGVGAPIEQAGFRVLKTGQPGVRATTRLKGIARPKAKSISFIAELPQRVKAVEPLRVTRFKPKTGRLETPRPEVVKVISKPEPRATGLISKQIVKAETKVPEIVTQAVERQAVKSLIRTRQVTRPVVPAIRQSPVQRSKTEFKSSLEKEKFALGQKSALSTDLTQTRNPLFDAVQDVSVKQGVTPTQTTAQLITPRMAQPTALTPRLDTPRPEVVITPKPIVPILPKRKPKLVSGQGYNVLVKRQATDTAKARYEKINTKPLTKISALSEGAEVTDKDISASFKIKKAPIEYEKIKKGAKDSKKKKVKKKILDTGNRYFGSNQEKFREYKKRKGKKLVTTGRFIEKRKYRLDTPSERQEIGQAPRRQGTGLFMLPGEQRPPQRQTFRRPTRQNSVPLIPINDIPKSRPQQFENFEPQQEQTGLMRLGAGVNKVQNTFDRFNGAMAKTSDRIKVNINPRNRTNTPRRKTNARSQATMSFFGGSKKKAPIRQNTKRGSFKL